MTQQISGPVSSRPTNYFSRNDVLHPGKAIVSKTEIRGKTGQNVQDQMSSLYLDSEHILVVVRQLALAWFTIPWIMQRWMSPNTGLQDMARMRRTRPQENSARNTRTEWRKSGGLQRPTLVLAKRYSLSRKIQKCFRFLVCRKVGFCFLNNLS